MPLTRGTLSPQYPKCILSNDLTIYKLFHKILLFSRKPVYSMIKKINDSGFYSLKTFRIFSIASTCWSLSRQELEYTNCIP